MSSPNSPRASQGADTDPATESTPAPAPTRVPSTNPELQLSTLQSLPAEQQDLYLLNFVASLSKHALALAADDCTAQQFYLKKEVFQIINLQTPSPGRVIRNNLGKILAHVLGKGDRKLLFETVNELSTIVSSSKSKTDSEVRTKHAAVVCLGDVYAAAGDSAINLHALACGTLVKLVKSSQSHAGLRAAAFTTLGKVAGMIQGSMEETIARDIWKQARSAATSDKGSLTIVSACRCLKSLVRNTPYFENSGDFDSLKSTILKIIDSSSSQVRHAAADCLAEAMVKNHSEQGASASSALKFKKPKRTNTFKRASMAPGGVVDEEDDIPSRPGSPAPGGGKKSQDLVLSLQDIMKTLSTQYTRMSTTNRARAAIGVCYGRVVKRLGEKFVETNYIRILEHLAVDILGNQNILNNRYRLLISRRIVDTVLQDIIGRRILGESGQMRVAKSVVNEIFKNYPEVIKERPEPSKYTLISSLGAVTSLINSLGSASNDFAEGCRDGLLQILQHPSYTVQVYASQCMKALVLACPQQLLSCLSICMNSLTRELNLLTGGRNSPTRCVGFAHGLAAALSTSSARPLYGSLDINNRVYSMATNLLKSSGQSELRVSSAQIQVAWILLGGLMSLGPNFVKIHLSQLLVLWKNALPKPLAKDNFTHRSILEVSFLTHVKECALSCILSFLQFNSRLLTVDVSKRIATMLQGTTAFLKLLPSKRTTDDISQRLTPALQLQDLDMMAQRRVLQCYVKLVNQSPPGGIEALLQSNLLTIAISLFADPENYGGNSLSASIANAAGTFETVWEVGDNAGFGVNGLIRGFKSKKLPGEKDESTEELLVDETDPDRIIDSLLLSPICPSLEHDAATLYIGNLDPASELPDPPATEVVNMAVRLFAFVFPVTPAKVQESVLEQIATYTSAGSLQRDPGRKAAMAVNIASALLSTLKVAVKETQSSSGNITNPAVEKLLQEMIREFVVDPDQYIRSIGYGAIARLCNASGNGFTNHEVKYLVDMIVGNREPSVRAGCSMALGCIQAKVGGMGAAYHLKTITGILMSLCNDPHPTVHYWALEALGLAADAAGLGFGPYVSGTLGMLAQLYLSESHHTEVASPISMSLEMELSTVTAIARCVDSLINVVGPDLQDSTKSRELIFTLVGQFQKEEDILTQRACLGCLEHLSLYAPGHMVFADYVKLLQKYLKSEFPDIRDVAVDGLYNLMKRDPHDVLLAADPGFEDQLWLVLDTSPDHDGIRTLVRNWLRQTFLKDTSAWLSRCQNVLKMTRPKVIEPLPQKNAKPSANIDLHDEEVAGFAAAAGASKDEKDPAGSSEMEPLRWQVRTFAMSCLSDIFILVTKDVATNGESPAQPLLQSRIADVIRTAFSASTSSVLELRIWGLKIIGAVLKMFGKTPDPDFEEAMLLEQYQAQISSALTPAFAADSSPELASEAVNVCAAFISTGIVTDVDRMGRILKTLVTGLENFSTDVENAGIGDLKGLSPNAQVMVKMSVFSAWADLQVASLEQKYLLEVLKPHVNTLTPLWLASLREFARLRFEPDISMTLGPPSMSGSLETIYSALNRETLLRFYQESWLKLVDAIASLIEQDSEFVFDALDGKETDGPAPNGQSKGADINYRDEPVAFFFVLFGIAFEALATRPGQTDSLATQEQTLPILQALKKILHPSVSGQAIYREAIFSETMDLLDRLVLTESLDVQSVIVEIARALCIAHPSARKNGQTEDGDLSEDIEQLFELTRIIVLVLSGLLPNLTEANQQVRYQLTEESVLLVRTGLSAIVDAAEVFPAIIKTDLHACIIHIFATILATSSCQEIIVPQALPMFKRFVASMANSRNLSDDKSPTDSQVQGCLRRFLSIYLNAQRRDTPQSLQCVKNCLLIITILFTGGNNRLAANDRVVAKFLDEVLDCLTDRMTAKIAANCIRSLMLQNSPTPADQSIARYLLPRLVAFVSDTDRDDPEGARKLVAQTLTQYVSVISKDHAQIAMSIVVPTLLNRAANEGDEVYKETSTRLLELASVNQAAFKGIVGAMNEGQKAFMEEVLRSGRQDNDADRDNNNTGQPSITLKMNFGGS
ncbi:armadillo-type protein [Xylaria bambusicola]|uniref:armadillo-type protein n=1 Tax=Xylaria bambusicola TaxID=326684 RepID=UPI00200846BC|nr:armadillo-type protein [Xylaria bambusicola]KAI0527879.1 armadillo-type protein [Xylaria bambusicola]